MCFEGYLPRFSRKSVPDVVTAFWGFTNQFCQLYPKNVNYISFLGYIKEKSTCEFLRKCLILSGSRTWT